MFLCLVSENYDSCINISRFGIDFDKVIYDKYDYSLICC